ncbi:MAG: carbon-nitrogen hydrolase family protein [Ardenticatenaceae bacterium]|nr:carbon-nitrogen hydrolase family protein [Ardenticatenaceae bacterium]
MRICAAQTRPITGDIPSNIIQHKKWIERAAVGGADMIFFPELSLTGYEPRLAKALAATPSDSRFDVFQSLADARQITIGVGLPTPDLAGICISMLVFQPGAARQVYAKQYLHADEEEFFVAGQDGVGLIGGGVAPAICYELSVPEHAQSAFRRGAAVYVASVAKFSSGIGKARQRLAEIARTYGLVVMMANCVGLSDGQMCAGQTAVWNSHGNLIGQLDGTEEGLILFDTDAQKLVAPPGGWAFAAP